MSGKIAGEMAQMDSLAKDFTTGSSEVQNLMTRLDGITNNTVGPGWEGRSARQFQDLWNSEFKTALNKLNGALQEASSEVTKRKQALQAADS